MLAGVCGGVARAHGIDPIVLRVAVAVLTFFGGAGVVVYVAGWLLMPDGEDEQSLAQRVLGRRIGGNRASWLLAGLLIVAGGITLHAVFGDHYGPWHPAVVLLLVVAVLWARKRARGGDWPPPASTTPTTPTTPTPPVPPAAAWTPPPAGESVAPADPAAAWSLTTPLPPPPPVPPAGPPAAPPVGFTPAPGPVPRPPRPRSRLGATTCCVILFALGLLAAIDALGADVPLPTYPAVVVAGAALGLLIGTWYGRARGLIVLGLLGVLALPPTAFAEAFHGGWVRGTREIVPTNVSELLPRYEYRGGEVHLDLSKLDLDGQDTRSTVRLGAGELLVTVPADTDVTVHVKLSAGQFETFGAEDGGLDLARTVRDDGPDGPGGGTLELTIRQGVGHLEVRRAEPTLPQLPAVPDNTPDASIPTEAPRAAA
jgi:phage shock protein PspC (stress-responsive transcriptional regulator)